MRRGPGIWLLSLLLWASTAAAAAARCPAGDAGAVEPAADRARQRGEWARAADWLACAAVRSGDAALAERATRGAFELRQVHSAVTSARRWLALAPDSETARRHLAIALLRDYDAVAAAREFTPLLAVEDRARAWNELLGILAEERNEAGAAQVAEQLAAADAGLPEAQLVLSVLWQHADHGRRALAAAERALALRPDWRAAQYAVLRALLTLGRRDEALARSAALAADGDAQARLGHAWILLGLGRREEAAALFGELRREGPLTREALEALGVIALDDRRHEDASRLFGELGRAAGSGENVPWYLGRLAEQRGDRALAALHYQQVRTGSRAAAAQLRAWRLWREDGQPERAELQLDEFLAATPASTGEIVAGVAGVLADAGQSAEAVALLDRALRQLAGGDLLFARAIVHEKRGAVRAAVADLRALLAERPQSPDAWNALGYTLVDHGLRLREGHELIERALALRPDSFAIQDSKGWALVRLGRPAEGLPWLEAAFERSADPEVAAHLGEALWLLGRQSEARELWERVLGEHPDSAPLRKAIARRAGS
ncbi:MAG: tetratricopeptide repeat protein [Gammaproteobacteria bacterium]|nr:tetratricopeptide repeat protein [Gammaproteobacteria bacterium]